MTTDKLLSVFTFYRGYLVTCGAVPERNEDDSPQAIPRINHLLWMCNEATAMVAVGRIEKAMRWLGFIQGYLHAWGMFTLEEIKNHSRPDEGNP